jgi:DNA repair exonuclease SbcCD nuclease subunit
MTGVFLMVFVVFNLKAQTDTLSFLHITDLHLIFNQEMYQENLAQSRKHYAQGVNPLKKFLRIMPEKTRSSMVIATGDLLDSYETEAKNREMVTFAKKQFLRVLKKSKVPVFPTLGNHDITSYSWENHTRVSEQDNAGKARAKWIRDVSQFKNGTYYSHKVSVGTTNYRLIFLDNSFNRFHSEEKVEIPFLDKPQLHWLSAQLQESPNDVEIILMHIPMNPGMADIAENNTFFSLVSRQPSLRLICAGHNHRNDIKEFQNAKSHFYQVQTGAFAQEPKNWRLIRLTENSILVSVPGDEKTEVTIPVNLF